MFPDCNDDDQCRAEVGTSLVAGPRPQLFESPFAEQLWDCMEGLEGENGFPDYNYHDCYYFSTSYYAQSRWLMETNLWRVPSPRQRVADYLPLPLPFTKSADGKERDVQTKNACGWGTNQPTTSPVAYHSPRVSVIALGLPSRFRCACSGANEMWRQNQQYTPQNQLL